MFLNWASGDVIALNWFTLFPGSEETVVAVKGHADSSTTPDVQLQWVDICLIAKQSGLAKSILQNCAGWANPKELTAIMGPSGAKMETYSNLGEHAKREDAQF